MTNVHVNAATYRGNTLHSILQLHNTVCTVYSVYTVYCTVVESYNEIRCLFFEFSLFYIFKS